MERLGLDPVRIRTIWDVLGWYGMYDVRVLFAHGVFTLLRRFPCAHRVTRECILCLLVTIDIR